MNVLQSILPISLTICCSPLFAQIALPPEPDPVIAPSRTEEEKKRDFDERRETFNKQLEENGVPGMTKEPSPSLKRDRELLAASLRPGPLDFGISLQLLLPYIQTSGSEREDYELEPSAGIHVFYRPLKNQKSEEVALWTGFRANYFQGIGTYEGNHGNFSFAYFGPMIGVGKFSPGSQSSGQEAFKDKKSVSNALVSRHGFFFLGGIAAQSRTAESENDREEPEDDLNNKAINYDSPGLWAELWYANLNYNALSYNGIFGAQLGNGKTMVYLGIGVGGWY